MANEPEKEKEKGNNEKAMTKARLLKKHTVSDLSKTVWLISLLLPVVIFCGIDRCDQYAANLAAIVVA